MLAGTLTDGEFVPALLAAAAMVVVVVVVVEAGMAEGEESAIIIATGGAPGGRGRYLITTFSSLDIDKSGAAEEALPFVLLKLLVLFILTLVASRADMIGNGGAAEGGLGLN